MIRFGYKPQRTDNKIFSYLNLVINWLNGNLVSVNHSLIDILGLPQHIHYKYTNDKDNWKYLMLTLIL